MDFLEGYNDKYVKCLLLDFTELKTQSGSSNCSMFKLLAAQVQGLKFRSQEPTSNAWWAGSLSVIVVSEKYRQGSREQASYQD